MDYEIKKLNHTLNLAKFKNIFCYEAVVAALIKQKCVGNEQKQFSTCTEA